VFMMEICELSELGSGILKIGVFGKLKFAGFDNQERKKD
jgi:hypothetical protein